MQHWNAANAGIVGYLETGQMSPVQRNSIITNLEQVCTLAAVDKELAAPPNVLVLVEPGWLDGACQRGRDELLQLFHTFQMPLPANAAQLTSEQLCKLLATSWPKDCLNDWKPERVLGSGFEGVVYAACKEGKCNAVAKMQPIVSMPDLKCIDGFCNAVQREYYIQKAAEKVAPKTFDYFKCDSFAQQTGKSWGVIVMEKYDGTLSHLIKTTALEYQQLNDILLDVVQKVFYLASIGITHRDLNTDNVLYKRDTTGKPTFAIADYGFAYMQELGFRNRDVSSMQRYMPTTVNPYYDLAYLLMHLRRDTGKVFLQLPGLTDDQVNMVHIEMIRIQQTLTPVPQNEVKVQAITPLTSVATGGYI